MSRLTRRYPAVFELFCYWVRRTWPLALPFPFTSISVNYGYAAKLHRDVNNVGPSLTKAFGVFHGGALKYWEHDDGHLPLEELNQFSATVLQTGNALCLFDGRRGHEVEPFKGERYSFVFFCTRAFARAREDAVAFVSGLGAHMPTSASLERAPCLAPPRGYDLGRLQTSMREVCGMDAMPTYISWRVASLCNIDSNCLDKCLSFVISPALMVSICAVSKTISTAAHRPSSWCGTVVDASGRRPTGKAAMTHFKSWLRTKAVVVGNWERGSLPFLVHGLWVAWAFVHLQCANANALVSRLPIPRSDVLLMCCSNRGIASDIIIGIAIDTSSHAEITSALQGRPSQGTVVATVMSSVKSKAFRINGSAFGPSAEPIGRLRGLVQFSILDQRCVTIAAPGRRMLSARIPAKLAETTSYHCFVILPKEHDANEVLPCWSRRA